MRALGTTLRYAFAGSVIFGVTSMVRNLSQIQDQLGQIAAIGSVAGPGGSIPLTTQQISDLGSQTRQAAIDAVTPVSDFNDAVLNLYSTIQNVPPNRAVEMVKVFAETARLTQTDVTSLQQVALQSQFAFHRPHTIEEARRQSREYFALISQAPGGAANAPQIYQQLGPLARVFAFGRGTQEQMLGFTLAALRGGGTPATNLRGLQYLAQTVASPDEQTKTSRAAFHSIGITDDFIRRHGIAAALRVVLQRINQGGVGGNLTGLRGLDDDALSQIEAQSGDDPFAAMSNLGVSGEGAQLAARLFHRVHALRTVIGLATRTQHGPGVESTVADDLTLINDAATNHVNDVNNLAKAWNRFRQQSRLPQAAQALQSASVGIATEAERIINYHGILTRGITSGGREVNRHPDIALGALLTTGALALRGGRLGLLTGAGRRVAGGAVLAQGLSGDTHTPGATPQNPMFVFIVGQLSNPFGRGITTGPGGGGPGPIVAGGAGSEATRVGRLARLRNVGGRLLGPVSVGLALGEGYNALFPEGDREVYGLGRDSRSRVRQHPILSYLGLGHMGGGFLGFGRHFQYTHDPTAGERGIMSLYQSGRITSDQAERRLRAVAQTHPGQWQALAERGIVVSGRATVDVNVHQLDAHGRRARTTKKSVSVDLLPDFTAPAPTHRGRAKTTRGGR
jgi:hypothetical protein